MSLDRAAAVAGHRAQRRGSKVDARESRVRAVPSAIERSGKWPWEGSWHAEVRAVVHVHVDAWDAMVEKPRDRAAQSRAVVEAADGTMEAIYARWVVHLRRPEPDQPGAVSVAVGSTGSFKHLETHELLTHDQLNDLLVSARECRRRYRPPHQAASVS
jgi:hypothetical protein